MHARGANLGHRRPHEDQSSGFRTKKQSGIAGRWFRGACGLRLPPPRHRVLRCSTSSANKPAARAKPCSSSPRPAKKGRPGSTCSGVAYKIHKYQVGNGVQKYIYTVPPTDPAWKDTSRPILPWVTTPCCRKICVSLKSLACSIRRTAAALTGATQSSSARSPAIA